MKIAFLVKMHHTPKCGALYQVTVGMPNEALKAVSFQGFVISAKTRKTYKLMFI